jgi:hypothetical protein
MAVHTAISIFFRQFLIFKVLDKACYLGKTLRSTGNVLMAQQTRITRIYCSHCCEISIVDLPVSMADFTGDGKVSPFLPVTVLFLMALLTHVRSLVDRKKRHLL